MRGGTSDHGTGCLKSHSSFLEFVSNHDHRKGPVNLKMQILKCWYNLSMLMKKIWWSLSVYVFNLHTFESILSLVTAWKSPCRFPEDFFQKWLAFAFFLGLRVCDWPEVTQLAWCLRQDQNSVPNKKSGIVYIIYIGWFLGNQVKNSNSCLFGWFYPGCNFSCPIPES